MTEKYQGMGNIFCLLLWKTQWPHLCSFLSMKDTPIVSLHFPIFQWWCNAGLTWLCDLIKSMTTKSASLLALTLLGVPSCKGEVCICIGKWGWVPLMWTEVIQLETTAFLQNPAYVIGFGSWLEAESVAKGTLQSVFLIPFHIENSSLSGPSYTCLQVISAQTCKACDILLPFLQFFPSVLLSTLKLLWSLFCAVNRHLVKRT